MRRKHPAAGHELETQIRRLLSCQLTQEYRVQEDIGDAGLSAHVNCINFHAEHVFITVLKSGWPPAP